LYILNKNSKEFRESLNPVLCASICGTFRTHDPRIDASAQRNPLIVDENEIPLWKLPPKNIRNSSSANTSSGIENKESFKPVLLKLSYVVDR